MVEHLLEFQSYRQSSRLLHVCIFIRFNIQQFVLLRSKSMEKTKQRHLKNSHSRYPKIRYDVMEILAGVLDDKEITQEIHEEILNLNAEGTQLRAFLDQFIHMRM